MTTKLWIDWTRCEGRGLCIELMTGATRCPPTTTAPSTCPHEPVGTPGRRSRSAPGLLCDWRNPEPVLLGPLIRSARERGRVETSVSN